MAGNWIKMRTNLWDDPRVSRLCDITGSGEAAVIGALYWLWSAADEHSEDGSMPGLSVGAIDRKTGVLGIGAALVEIGWITNGSEGLHIARFEEHNGASAKRRCSESRRKMSARDADTERTEGGQVAEEPQQSCAPREREREEVNNLSEQPLVESEVRAADAAPKKKSARKATQIPEGFTPNETGIAYAEGKRLQVSSELEAFRNFHTAKGSTWKDWQATWRTWCDKAVEFGRAGGGQRAGFKNLAQSRAETIAAMTGRGPPPTVPDAPRLTGSTIEGEAHRVAG